MSAAQRGVISVVTAHKMLEGGGFPVRRPFPTADQMDVDPFLLLDHLGPVDWGPGEGIGAPDHPHRGFETVTYLLSGEMEHKDSRGHTGKLRPGDVQWMTAGSGVVHSELPSAKFMKEGGTMHGFQLWVNLPAKDKMTKPRYQEIPREDIPSATSEDGLVKVVVIAGKSLGVSAIIDTHTPIMYLHFSIKPGGSVVQAVPSDYNAFAYIIKGEAAFGPKAVRAREGQSAIFDNGNNVTISVPLEGETTDMLLLAGRPINEPIERYGPFVMNTREEIRQAIRDSQQGRMGKIDI
ncbi:MAG: pirin family protein [Acidiferrobacterales bacterium]